jgi:hypothetical protein
MLFTSLNAQAGEIAVKDGETIAFLGDSIAGLLWLAVLRENQHEGMERR